MTPSTVELQPLPLDSRTAQAEGYRSLLSNPSFMAIWLGQVFSQLADRIVFVVFIAAIVQFFGTEEQLKSYLYIAFTIPAMLLTAVAGVFVDRWHRRNTLVGTNILRALLVLGLPVALAQHQLLGLYACAFGISTVTQFFVPAESASIPMLVRPTQLMVANALFTTTMMASLIFGFTLGDPLIEWLSLSQVHWALVILYGLAAMCVMFVKAGVPAALVQDKSNQDQRGFNQPLSKAIGAVWADMKEGLDYLRATPLILHKILLLTVLFSVVVAATIVFVSFANEVLYQDPVVASRKFVWLITASGVGMVMASIGIGRWARHAPKQRLIYEGFVMMGLGLLLLCLTQFVSTQAGLWFGPKFFSMRLLYAHSISFLLGVGAAYAAVPLQSLLHLLIPEDKRGKILGIQFTLLSTASTLPVLIAGIGSDTVGVTPILLLMGIPLLLLGSWGFIDGMIQSPEVAAESITP